MIIPWCECTTVEQFTHWKTLGLFLVWARTEKAAMTSKCFCVSRNSYFCRISAQKCNCWILSLCLVCNKQLIYFSSVDVALYVLTSNVQLIPFLCSLASNWYYYYFYLSHSDRHNFNLRFSSGSWCWISFCVFIYHLCTLFGDTSLPVFADVLISLGFFIVYKSFAGYVAFKYSFSVCNLSFHSLKQSICK